jgi:hypothetical protein
MGPGSTALRVTGMTGKLHASHLHQHRRADQRHRLGQIPQADGRRGLPAALSVARQQVEAGARSSTSTWTRACWTASQAMRTFLNLIAAEPDIARVPVMIDSSKWEVIEAG